MVAFWLVINSLFIIAMLIWSLFHESDGVLLEIATVFSQLAVVLVMLNLNMYFIFVIIRKSSSRNVKIRLAKISRRAMKIHVPIAISAASLIVIHIALIALNSHLDFKNIKIITGILAVTGLIFVLAAGYLRSRKATGKRRKFHILTAFTFFMLIVVHIFSN